MANTVFSVRITGKNVADEYLAPSLVFPQAGTLLNPADTDTFGGDHTRVIYPHGQRLTNGGGMTRGNRIQLNETRSLSAGRHVPSRQFNELAGPEASAKRLKERKLANPKTVSNDDRNSDNRGAPISSAGRRNSPALRRRVDERRNLDNELKRAADSAAWIHAEQEKVSTCDCVMQYLPLNAERLIY